MNNGKIRAKSHINESKSIDIFKNIIPDEWVIRKYDPDYGIDLSVELFENENGYFCTQGEYIHFQVKSIEKLIIDKIKIYSRINIEKKPLYAPISEEWIEVEVIKFSIDTSTLAVVERMGSAVPVLLLIVDIDKNNIYYICLNDYIEKVLLPSKPQYLKQKRSQ